MYFFLYILQILSITENFLCDKYVKNVKSEFVCV